MQTRRRDRAGEPTPEELIAYSEGSLSADERSDLERRLPAYPEAARALADLRRFPDLEPAPGADPVTPADVERGLADFHSRIEKRVAERQPRTGTSAGAANLSPRWLPLAAMLVLGVGLGFGAAKLLPSGLAEEPRVGIQVVQLLPDGDDLRRGSDTGRSLSGPSGGSIVLVLVLPNPADVGPFELRMRGPRNVVAWSQPAVSPQPPGILTLNLPAGSLEESSHSLELIDPSSGDTVARYSFRWEVR